MKPAPAVPLKAIALLADRANMALYGGIWKPWSISSARDRGERCFQRDREGNCAGYRASYPAPGSRHPRRVSKRAAVLCLMIAVAARAGEQPGEWTGPYPPCDGHAEVLKREPMDLGVRFSTSNPTLKAEFARAMRFWAGLLEMNWHEENSRACAIQAVDGGPDLFRPGEVARAQFPGQPAYQGWIAFNPRASLPANELFLTAVHELGHLLGLPHSSNASSVMYFLALDGPVFLDSADLAALAARHRLRAEAGTGGDASRSAVQAWRRLLR